MTEFRIIVPWDVSRTSPNQRLHWSERHRRNQTAMAAATVAWIQAGFPHAEGPVRVGVVIRRAAALDADNALAGAKPVLDRLFCGRRFPGGAITPDDSPEWVEIGGITLEIARRWKGIEEVEVVVEPREASE